MSINKAYANAGEMPQIIPVFPLGGALLLPRGQMPLNIFEPRYLAMIDDAMRAHRIVGMVQPAFDAAGRQDRPALNKVGCAGRITQLAETGDGRYMLALSGVARFGVIEEIAAITPYRQCRVDFAPYAIDFTPAAGEELVDRDGLLNALKGFAKANKLQVDWDSINEAPNEALVNALSMMSPFGPQEKQALLEAGTLKMRADVLIAISEMETARSAGTSSALQ